MRVVTALMVGAMLVACSSSTIDGQGGGGSGCPGPEVECTCPDGRKSTQLCVDNALQACDCPGPDEFKDAGACVSAGGDCRDDANACCNGFTCVYDVKEPSKSVCASTCLRDDQCNSGCCTELIAGTAKVCAPQQYCVGGCAQPNAGCSSTPCCGTGVCVDSTVTGVSCAARCTTSSQCVSGCCAPLSNTGELVCSPVTFCQ